MDIRLGYKKIGMALFALIVLLTIWRMDTVQENLRPARFWAAKVPLIELEVEVLRNKVAECSILLRKGQDAPENAGRLATFQKLCASYDEDLRTAVDNLLAAKKKSR